MTKIESLQTGKKYIVVTTENKEYKGIFLDKNDTYIFLKNVKFGRKFVSLYTIPLKLIVRIS